MRIDTPKDCLTHLLKNPEQYITKVGAFLRKTSLDELPQIFNIFKGDMSVIGPRPALWNQDDLISERDEYGINDLKPGLTGWAQINGRDELPIPEKVQMDKIYRDNVSFAFDVKCLFMTVVSVFKHDGVVEGGTGAIADEFVDRKIISVDKETILNGAGIYEYKPYPKSDPPHFLYLGRIMKEKGMDELFSAAEKLHDDGYKFVLDLVGFFEDEYKERVELLESKGVVKFHGFQEEPRPYYATADCVVMPSYHEGMSNVNLEASATGRPVITTDIPGCRESVENEYTGWLCEPKSVDSLYEKMKAFLETDISKREVMGKYARQKMVDEFDKKIVVNDTVKALKL